MPSHAVRFTLPERPLGIVDADFMVERDGTPLGTLKISQGGVVWIPKGARNHRFVHWPALADFIETNGRVIPKVKRKKAVAKKTTSSKAKSK